jgi:hypothetical protein
MGYKERENMKYEVSKSEGLHHHFFKLVKVELAFFARLYVFDHIFD